MAAGQRECIVSGGIFTPGGGEEGGELGGRLWKKPESVCRLPEINERQSYTTNMLFKDSGRLIIDKSDAARSDARSQITL